MVRWGLWCGVASVSCFAVGHRVIPMVFTTDPQVRDARAASACSSWPQPARLGVVFVPRDGVLIGAGDAVAGLGGCCGDWFMCRWRWLQNGLRPWPAALGYLQGSPSPSLLARGAAPFLSRPHRCLLALVLGAD